jgi:hypothetical protein
MQEIHRSYASVVTPDDVWNGAALRSGCVSLSHLYKIVPHTKVTYRKNEVKETAHISHSLS